MKVTINQKAQERLIRGHDWIFRSDLLKVEAEEAGVAEVVGDKGKSWGQALYSPKSLIALRMMSRGPEPIDAKLLAKRIQGAIARREAWYPGENVYRAIFGEADGLPSLVVDRFADVVVFQTLSAGMETFKEKIIEILSETLKPRALIERNDSPVRQREELPLIRQARVGEAPAEAVFSFAGRTFGFDPLEGQKTGFFLDQRFNAAAAARYAHGAMLDAFSYVGQFGLHAAHQVDSVLAVDASEPALRQVERNASANDLKNVSTLEANAFDFLKEADKEGRRFDTISLDPPAFVKNRGALPQALRGYKEINLRALRMLKPGGVLITSSCSQHMSSELFERMLIEAGKDARHRLQVLEKRGQPADHPVLLTMPETDYLKCYILRVI